MNETPEQVANPLDTVVALCHQLDRYEAEKVKLEEELQKLNGKIKELSTKAIPDMMLSLNLTELRLTNGHKIAVKPDIMASVSKDRMHAVLAWLHAHNAQAIAKQKLVVDISDLSQEAVQQIHETVTSYGTSASVDASIHPSTLRAFVKEQLEQNTPNFPRELFGVHEGSKAVITIGR
jgi:predicted  nucleic acid-binding Zn-ribbon protein